MSVSVVDPTFAHLETLTRPTPCTEELSQINESLRRREALLVASAKASRMLLEAPDVRGTIPGVLRLIGEAAHVDRVNVMRARRGPEGEPLLVVVSEWTAEGVPPHIDDPAVCMCDERQFSAVSAELRAGRSVCLNKSESPVNCAGVAGFEGIGTKTKAIVPIFCSSFGDRFTKPTEPMYLDVEQQSEEFWPGMLAFHRQEGYAGTVVYPLVFGSRNVGFLILRFRRNAADVQRSELLVALAQQATLAVQLTRLAYQAKEAAVLVERARIGQEIHDGLAQAFTGILMQLGAVEEFPSCKKKNSGLALTHTRIRDLAREGLAEARRSVMALRLDQTRRAGLELALRQLAERSTVPGGVTCNFEGGGITTGLKPEHEHELLRIAQEAVSNAVRHARPKLVRITMTDEEAHWVLAVEDDGR